MRKTGIFLLLLLIVQTAFPKNIDIELLKAVNVGRDKSFDSFFIALSFTAEYLLWLVPASILAYGFISHRKKVQNKGWFILTTMAFASMISLLIKTLINRPRPFVSYPFIEKISVGGSASFPSGHTVSAFALALAVAIAFRNRYSTIIVFAWATAVGFSRIYCGVHYPSDVAAGIVLGLISTYGCYLVFKGKNILN
jgi:membrane-associated phospholipid phosphatase